jgi:hypothetical protein
MKNEEYGQFLPLLLDLPWAQILGGTVLAGSGLILGRYVIPKDDYSSCVSALIGSGINSSTATTQCQGKTTAPWWQQLILPASIVIGGIIAVPPLVNALRQRLETKLAPKK